MLEPLMRRASARRILSVTAGVAAAAALVFASGPTASASDHTAFPNSKPSWARSATDAGAAPATATYEVQVAFELQDPAGAEQLAQAVSTPGSPLYGHPLSPARWIARFSPDAVGYAAVVRYLKAAGLQISATPKSRLFITLRGTAQQLGTAFSTALHRYHHDGRLLAAPSTAPSLPTSLARSVAAVHLGQSAATRTPTSASPSDVVSSGATPTDTVPASIDAPCSTYYGQHTAAVPSAYGATSYPTDLCGYTGKQLRSAYGATGLTGAGQKVAIVDAYASPSIRQDVDTLAAKHGGAALRTYSQIVAPKSRWNDQDVCTGAAGWQGEQTLDVVAVHDIAPKAKILYVGGFNCNGGLDAALSTVLDGKLADIVTNSYGWVGDEVDPGYFLAEENQHIQAAGEGIGLYYSSGDDGDVAALTGTAEASFEASSPYVTAVGGSTVGITRSGSVALETGWGSASDQIVEDTGTGALGYAEALPGDFTFGAGGGRSTQFDEPWYQQGVVPDSLAQGKRVNADVSADADPFTGELVGIRPILDEHTLATGPYVEDSYGGTSLASPLFAAEIALVQQAVGQPLGFANPLLYSAYKVDPSAFRDVLPAPTSGFAFTSTTSGDSFLVTNDRDTSLATTAGYDAVTGLGSLTLGQLERICARR